MDLIIIIIIIIIINLNVRRQISKCIWRLMTSPNVLGPVYKEHPVTGRHISE